MYFVPLTLDRSSRAVPYIHVSIHTYMYEVTTYMYEVTDALIISLNIVKFRPFAVVIVLRKGFDKHTCIHTHISICGYSKAHLFDWFKGQTYMYMYPYIHIHMCVRTCIHTNISICGYSKAHLFDWEPSAVLVVVPTNCDKYTCTCMYPYIHIHMLLFQGSPLCLQSLRCDYCRAHELWQTLCLPFCRTSIDFRQQLE
jgi:hypothetical protein